MKIFHIDPKRKLQKMSKNLKFYTSENDPHNQRREIHNPLAHAPVTSCHWHVLVTCLSCLHSQPLTLRVYTGYDLQDILSLFSYFQEPNLDSMASCEDSLSLVMQELERCFVLPRSCRFEFFLKEWYPLFHSPHLKKRQKRPVKNEPDQQRSIRLELKTLI